MESMAVLFMVWGNGEHRVKGGCKHKMIEGKSVLLVWLERNRCVSLQRNGPQSPKINCVRRVRIGGLESSVHCVPSSSSAVKGDPSHAIIYLSLDTCCSSPWTKEETSSSSSSRVAAQYEASLFVLAHFGRAPCRGMKGPIFPEPRLKAMISLRRGSHSFCSPRGIGF